jgi:hypothetical protein
MAKMLTYKPQELMAWHAGSTGASQKWQCSALPRKLEGHEVIPPLKSGIEFTIHTSAKIPMLLSSTLVRL